MMPFQGSKSLTRYTGLPRGVWYTTLLPSWSMVRNMSSGTDMTESMWFSGSTCTSILTDGLYRDTAT